MKLIKILRIRINKVTMKIAKLKDALSELKVYEKQNQLNTLLLQVDQLNHKITELKNKQPQSFK